MKKDGYATGRVTQKEAGGRPGKKKPKKQRAGRRNRNNEPEQKKKVPWEWGSLAGAKKKKGSMENRRHGGQGERG